MVLIFWPILYEDIYYNFFHWRRCHRLRRTIKSSVLFIKKRTFTRHKTESNWIYITRIWLRRTVTELIKKKNTAKNALDQTAKWKHYEKKIMHWYWTVDKKNQNQNCYWDRTDRNYISGNYCCQILRLTNTSDLASNIDKTPKTCLMRIRKSRTKFHKKTDGKEQPMDKNIFTLLLMRV